LKTEVTDLASQIHSLIQENKIEEAKLLLPKEILYIPSEKIQEKIEISIV